MPGYIVDPNPNGDAVVTGQMTIIDQNDAPPITAYIAPNFTTQQVYDANKDGALQYTPNYAVTPLVLTPHVYAGDVLNIAPLLDGIHWTKNDPSGPFISINPQLTISANKTPGSQPDTYYFHGVYTYKDLGLDTQVTIPVTVSIVSTGIDGEDATPGGTEPPLTIKNFASIKDTPPVATKGTINNPLLLTGHSSHGKPITVKFRGNISGPHAATARLERRKNGGAWIIRGEWVSAYNNMSPGVAISHFHTVALIGDWESGSEWETITIGTHTIAEISFIDIPGIGVIDYRISWVNTSTIIGELGWVWQDYLGYAWELETEEVVNP